MISAFASCALDLLDASLDEALLLARGMVFGVLAQISMARASAIALMMLGAILGLEPLELHAQPFSASRGDRCAFHATQLLVQILQAVDVHLVQMIERIASGARRCNASCNR